MANWSLHLGHIVASLPIALQTGTADDNFPFDNARTLDPNVRGRATPDTNVVNLRFNRGTTDGLTGISSILIAAHDIFSVAGKWQAESDTGLAFASPTTLVAVKTPSDNSPILETFTSSVEKFFRLKLTNLSAAVSVGTVSFGKGFDLGKPVLGGVDTSWGSGQGGIGGVSTPQFSWAPVSGRRVRETFRQVTRANALDIAETFSDFRLRNLTSYNTDGYGNGQGAFPFGMKDGDGTVFYGFGSIQVDHVTAYYSNVTVDIAELPITQYA